MSVALGLLFGIINTLMLHLAKAMERHGIEIFSRKKSFKEKGKKPLIYIVGFIINNTVMVWQIIGTTFASAAVFSSVFGLGLILLMLYSRYILHEKITKIELLGAILIIIGTTLVGFFYIIEPPVTGTINYVNFFILIIVMILLFSFLIGFSWKTMIAVAFIFGAIAGTLGGTDNVLKRIGLSSSNFIEAFAGLLRMELDSYIFLFSFLAGFFALIITQIGFAKGADASRLVPMYNSLYISAPVLFELLIVEGAGVSLGIILSIIIIIIGVFLMNIFKKKENFHKKNDME
ncbi:MAG: EamA family transporter [Candidatus Heimdallarchaeota archaeon]